MLNKKDKSQKIPKWLLIAILSGTVIGILSIPYLIYSRTIDYDNQQKEASKNLINQLLEESKNASLNDDCLILSRSSDVKIPYIDILRVPLDNGNGINNKTSVTTIIGLTNKEYAQAYFINNLEQGDYYGSLISPSYLITEENGKIILSFENIFSMLNFEIFQEISIDTILVVLLPKHYAHTIEIQPTSTNIFLINPTEAYPVKEINGEIVSAFSILNTIKGDSEKINEDLNEFIENNFQRGQLIIPRFNNIQNRIIEPKIVEPFQCQNIKNLLKEANIDE